MTFKRTFGALASALLLFALPADMARSQSANPFNPDFAWCNTPGAVATRNASPPLWGCLPPGTAGQVLRTNGPGANASWQTVTGSGTVTSVGVAMPSDYTVTNSPITTTGVISIARASQVQNLFLASPNGSTGTPVYRSIVSADLPTVPVSKGGTNVTTASGTALDNITGFSGTGLLRRTGAGTYSQGTTVSIAEGGTGAAAGSGTVLDNISGVTTGTGIVRRTGAGTYTRGTTVSVAEGGTGATAAGGTALDNVSGMSGTGIVRRTGAGTYTQGTQIATGEIADASVTTAKLATPAASGASMVLIGTVSVTNAASLPLLNAFSPSFDEYVIKFSNVNPITDNTTIRLEQGNGGTFTTTSYAGFGDAKCADGSAAYPYNGVTPTLGANASSSAAFSLSGTVEIGNVSDTTDVNFYRINTVFGQSGGLLCNTRGAIQAPIGAITDIRAIAQSGNITGTMSVYGIRQ